MPPTPPTPSQPIPAGGFFDGKTSAAERQAYLLDVIRSSQQQAQRAGGSGDASDGQLSDEEVNLGVGLGGMGCSPVWAQLFCACA